MNGIDLSGLDELDKKLEQMATQMPELRAEMYEEMAEMLEGEVAASLKENATAQTGTMESWQQSRVGSRGGYAAVSPKKGKEGKHSFGKITNAAESGHRVRGPSGKAKRYRGRINTLRVGGLHFYADARRKVATKALNIAQKYVDRMVEQLEE